MNAWSVVTFPATHAAIASALLPAPHRRAEGAGCEYYLYPARMQEFSCLDLDGTPLIDVHAFATEADAHAWVALDVARRRQGRPQ
jgi:hypothetical protein